MIRKYSFMDSVFDIMSKNLLLLFSRSVMFNSLWPHGPQHTRLSCPLLSPQGSQWQWSGRGALYSTRLLGGGPAPGWPAAVEGPGSPSLLGVLQHRSVPANDYSRVFAQVLVGTLVGTLTNTQRWWRFTHSRGPPVGQPGCQACPLATWNSWRVYPC